MMVPGPSMNMDSASAQVKRLINAQLKQVCKSAGLPVSGAKAALQSRIISQLQNFLSQGNNEGFYALKNLIYNPDSQPTTSTGSTRALPPNAMANSASSYHTSLGGPSLQHGPAPSMALSGLGQRLELKFKQSPFSKHIMPLTKIHKLEIREATRDTLQESINLSQDIVTMLNNDSNTRIMAYCAVDNGSPPQFLHDVAFPQQVEIKVNGDDVKSNLRGLKNKPGTTRPADITGLLRKRAGYKNEMLITYALTKQRFHLVVNLVKQIPVETLVSELKHGKIISKERVIREMQSRADDQDIVATSTVLSLKCPLSYLRIDVPCRSTMCKHNQCFDATSFLQLQEQAPTWTCPVCHENVKFENLQVDQYVDDILKTTPKSMDQVTIEPNGSWSSKGEAKPSSSPGRRRATIEPDEDLIEIQDPPGFISIKAETSQEHNMLSTPPVSSREPPTSNGNRPPGGVKRSATEVVELSDDDEGPIRTPKRRQPSIFANGVANAEAMSFKSGAVSPFSPNEPPYSANHYPLQHQYSSTNYLRPPDHPSSY